MSPNPPKRPVVEKDEGISDEEDTAELKLQLELNEQVNTRNFQNLTIVILCWFFCKETAVLRRKVVDLERDSESSKRQVQDLQEKLATKKDSPVKKVIVKKSGDKDPLSDKKIQVMEDEINELRKKLIEKDRDFERVQAEQTLTKGKSKIGSFKPK